MKLDNKRAIITGSSKGIGLAIAERLVEAGCSVVISARSQDDVQSVASSLDAAGPGRAFGKACDVADHQQVSELVEFSAQQLGGLDILINNAGIGIFKKVEDMSVEEWRRLISTNLDGVFYATRFALPKLKESGSGFIINISSLAGKNAFPTGAAYNSSKFALTGFSEALMQEVRHDDIRVAYIMPGSVDTWFRGGAPGHSEWKLSAGDVADVVIDTLRRHPRCLTSRIEMRPSKPPKS